MIGRAHERCGNRHGLNSSRTSVSSCTARARSRLSGLHNHGSRVCSNTQRPHSIRVGPTVQTSCHTSGMLGSMSSRTPAQAQRLQPVTRLPLHSSLPAIATRSVSDREQRGAAHVRPIRSLTTAAGKRNTKTNTPGPLESSHDDNIELLLNEGLTDEQALRVLTFYASCKQRLNIINVQEWLQLLHSCHVEDPATALSRHPVMLTSRADNLAGNAESVVQWMYGRGLTSAEVVQLISAWPGVIRISPANLVAVEAWLCSDLQCSDAMVTTVFKKAPRLFSLRPSNLAPKLAWCRSIVSSDDAARNLLLNNRNLLSHSVEQYESQLVALHALGLSHSEAVALVVRNPTLLGLDIAGSNQQAKVRFLTEVMGRSIHEISTCSSFFTYSLVNRIGPRWAFHALHCPDQPYTLSSKLKTADSIFASQIKASSRTLGDECLSRGLGCLDLFQEFAEHWKQGEGRKWVPQKQTSQK